MYDFHVWEACGFHYIDHFDDTDTRGSDGVVQPDAENPHSPPDAGGNRVVGSQNIRQPGEHAHVNRPVVIFPMRVCECVPSDWTLFYDILRLVQTTICIDIGSSIP
jgi:hypothetical protein